MEEYSFKKTITRMSIFYLLTLALTLVLQYGIAFAISKFLPSLANNEMTNWFLNFIPGYAIAFPLCYLIIKKLPDTKINLQKEKIGGKRFLKILAVAFCLMIAGNLVSLILISLVNMVKDVALSNPLEDAINNGSFIISLFFVAVLAPICEEIVFRLLPYKKLIGYGEKPYIIFTALIFGLYHLNLFQSVYAFLVGTVLAYVFVKTKNIFYSMAIHLIINMYGIGVVQIVNANEFLMIPIAIIVYSLVGYGIFTLISSRKKVIYENGDMAITPKPTKNIVFNIGMIGLIIANIVVLIIR